MRIQAKNLQAGDKIPAPTHERKWLKSLLTVVSVEGGAVDKGGLWLKVRATFESPYEPGAIRQDTFRYRPDTLVNKIA